MDFEEVSAANFGRSLEGIGINLLVADVRKSVEFLTTVLGMTAHRVSDDFAIMAYKLQVFQLHSDRTYGAHPLSSLVPETPPRGAGVQFYLFNHDPHTALQRAKDYGATIIEPPREKPHGLYEGTILCPDGYAWSPSMPSTSKA
jgi:predicted enzyme related to lactoylglutathione lyase